MSREASASAKDIRGGESPLPPPRNSFVPNPIPNGSKVMPSPIHSLVSIPVTQFEQFERDVLYTNSASPISHVDAVATALTSSTAIFKDNLTDINVMPASNAMCDIISSTPVSKDDCAVSNNTSTSSHVSPNINPIISQRSYPPPTLINTSVQDIYRVNSPMEIDNDSDTASRKRPSSQSKTENSGGNKAKKPSSDVSNALRDSLNNPHDKPTILYSTSDSPPYLIHVYSTADEAPSGPAHPLLISRTLSHLAYANIKEIKRIGRGKVLVEMKSAEAANKLILDPNLVKHKLKAFVPLYRIIRSGIVRDTIP